MLLQEGQLVLQISLSGSSVGGSRHKRTEGQSGKHSDSYLCLDSCTVYKGFGICCETTHCNTNMLINLCDLLDAAGLLQQGV